MPLCKRCRHPQTLHLDGECRRPGCDCVVEEVQHGADALVFDAIGRGWRIICTCGDWSSPPCRLAADAGAAFDQHLTATKRTA